MPLRRDHRHVAQYGAKRQYSPTNIPNLKVWLKADSLVLSDNDPVGTWTDSSGNSNSVTGVTTTRPLYKASIKNSLPVVRFDGTDDFLISSAFGAALSQPNTIFLVAKHGGTNDTLLVDGLAAGRHIIFRTGDNWAIYAGNTASNGAADTSFHVLSTVFNDTSSAIYVDGVGTTGIPASTQTMTGLTLGGNFNGTQNAAADIAEILVYNGSLNTNDRVQTQAYLGAKWGIAVSS